MEAAELGLPGSDSDGVAKDQLTAVPATYAYNGGAGHVEDSRVDEGGVSRRREPAAQTHPAYMVGAAASKPAETNQNDAAHQRRGFRKRAIPSATTAPERNARYNCRYFRLLESRLQAPAPAAEK